MGRYSWICHSSCPMCKPMEGSYETRPSRPHANCQCTIIDHAGSGSRDNNCIHPTTIALGGTLGGATYEPHDPPYPAGTHPTRVTVEHLVPVICRNGDMLLIETSITYDDPDKLNELWSHGVDCDAIIESKAVAKALAVAETECPTCREVLRPGV